MLYIVGVVAEAVVADVADAERTAVAAVTAVAGIDAAADWEHFL